MNSCASVLSTLLGCESLSMTHLQMREDDMQRLRREQRTAATAGGAPPEAPIAATAATAGGAPPEAPIASTIIDGADQVPDVDPDESA